MQDLKLIVASNLIKLRTDAGFTQADLGEKINYSDKTVSKWERAESLPDAAVLKRLAEIFGVSVDYLLCSHDQWEPQITEEEENAAEYNPTMITLISIFGIWTLAILIFVIFWILGHTFWVIFISAVPASLITLLVMNSIWNKGRHNRIIIALLVLSIIILIYLALYKYNPWQLFIVAVPAELMVFLSFCIKRKPQKNK
ncbi:MAG: helix-turn-helix domain-containing protein [Bacillota bacterium]|jgi:transcriptional regulator with XRE-family HTH domain